MNVKHAIFFIIIILLSISPVSAFTVSSVTMDPSGQVLTKGTPVTITYTIDFPVSGGVTFPSKDELQMSTDLDSPKWTYTLIIDGVENPRPQVWGSMLSLSGFELSYSANVEESVRVKLEGNAPSKFNPLLIRVQEIDENNQVISGTVYQLSQAASGSVNRNIPHSINPGSQVTIVITPDKSLDADPSWRVSESIPSGFTFVSTTAYYHKQNGPNSYTFIQNGNRSFSYVVSAPSTEGPYSVSGNFFDGNKFSGIIGGDAIINVGTGFQNYRNATTGKIEKADAQKAMVDFTEGKISSQVVGSVLENYFLNQ